MIKFIMNSLNHLFAEEIKADPNLPYRPKLRTKGQIVIEAGLKSLAETLWKDPHKDLKILKS